MSLAIQDIIRFLRFLGRKADPLGQLLTFGNPIWHIKLHTELFHSPACWVYSSAAAMFRNRSTFKLYICFELRFSAAIFIGSQLPWSNGVWIWAGHWSSRRDNSAERALDSEGTHSNCTYLIAIAGNTVPALYSEFLIDFKCGPRPIKANKTYNIRSSSIKLKQHQLKNINIYFVC